MTVFQLHFDVEQTFLKTNGKRLLFVDSGPRYFTASGGTVLKKIEIENTGEHLQELHQIRRQTCRPSL